MKITKIIKTRFDLDITELQKFSSESTTSRMTSFLPPATVENVLRSIIEKKKCTETVAVCLIAGLAQKGGTNKSATNSATFSLNVGDKQPVSLTAQELINIIKSHEKSGTIRQLARSLADEIYEVAIALRIEGDLASQMKYDHPELPFEDAAWCSNFQTTNPNCPTNVRNWLVNNYKSRFNR
jgi:hypothetical protein